MAQPIPKEVWNDHREAIVRLYIHEDLPLDKKDARNLIDVMKNDYQFSATSAQYQRQFKKWGLTKNLSRDSWESIFQHLDQPDSHNTSHQLRLSGRVLSKKRINRSRRHVRPSKRVAQQARASQLTARNPQIEITKLDDLQVDITLPSLGKVPAPLRDGASTSTSANPRRGPSISDADCFSGSELFQSPPQLYMGMPSLPVYDSPCFQASSTTPGFLGGLEPGASSQGIADSFCLTSLPSETQHGIGTRRSPVNNNDPIPSDRALPSRATIESISKSVTTQTPILRLHANLQTRSGHDLRRSQVLSPWRNASFSLSQRIPLPILASICLQKTKSSIHDSGYSTERDDCIALIDGMTSLLPKALQKSSSAPCGEEDGGAIFFKALLFSMINNFAGLGRFPPAFFVEFICVHPRLGEYILRGLSVWNRFVTKPLAENLFWSALLAGNVDIVRTILPILRETLCADLTGLSFVYRGQRRTPMEIAAVSRNLQALQVLLQAGFDPNQSYPGNEEPGALAHFLMEISYPEPTDEEDIEILRLLISRHRGGSKSLEHFVSEYHTDHVEAMRLVFSYLAPENHELVYTHILHAFDSTNDAEIVISVLTSCQERGCFGQHEDWRITLETLVRTAVSIDDYTLVDFLLGLTDRHCHALSTAVRSEETEMVRYLLQRGFDVDPDPFDPLYPCYSTYERHPQSQLITEAFPHDKHVTTPLAQAIRLQNSQLIREFEEGGALRHISKPNRFRAALTAASEVGHESYVRMLLRKVPKLDAANSKGALLAAMKNGHASVAMMLFEAGTCHNDPATYEIYPERLLPEALKSHDDIMIQLAFEYDIVIDEKAFEIAINDQNTGLVDLFLRLGNIPDDRGEPLFIAVNLGNRDLVKVLLEYGFNPLENTIWIRNSERIHKTAFAAAVHSGDSLMIDMLLRANPYSHSRTLFFKEVCACPPESRDLLINAYLDKYGQNVWGIGSDIFMECFDQKDLDLIKVLLRIQADINSISRGSNWSPFAYAVKHHSNDMALLQTLLDGGGDPNCVAWQSRRGRILGQKTTFMVAIDGCNIEVVRLLIAAGKADVNRAPGKGVLRTPLQEACEASTLGIVKLLLENGADVNEPPATRGGATALQLAAIRGHFPIAEFLVENGANIHASGAKVLGRTAFEGAAEHGRLDMLQYLWDAGPGRSFSIEELERGSALATEEGHLGCVEYIEILMNKLAWLLEDTDSVVGDSILELI